MQPQVHHARHGEGAALEQGVDNIQGQGAEHEHELQRLGDAGQEHGQAGGEEHGAVIPALVGIHMAVHGQGNAHQQAGGTDHLAHLEAGGGDGVQQQLIGGHVTGVLEIDQIGDPGQPQGVLTVDHGTGGGAGLDHVLTAEAGVVHGDGQHVVQAEGQQQTLQHAVDERSKDGGGGGGVCDPDAECIDAGLDQGPHTGHDQGHDGGVEDDCQGHESLAIEEGQRIGQLAEIIELVVDHAADEACDDAHEHAHVQGRCAQNVGEVVGDFHLLAEEGGDGGTGGGQHVTADTEDCAGDAVDENEGDDRCEGTACTLLGPGTADGGGEEDVQVGDDGPADVLHGGTNGDHQTQIHHLEELAQAQHDAGGGHDGDDRHQDLAQLLKEVEVQSGLLCGGVHLVAPFLCLFILQLVAECFCNKNTAVAQKLQDLFCVFRGFSVLHKILLEKSAIFSATLH